MIQKKKSSAYGSELIMDLHNCDVSTFNRASLRKYFAKLCKAIDMKRCELYFWDDVGVQAKDKQILPHTKGTSAVQFILTSNITIHTLDLLKAAYINLDSELVSIMNVFSLGKVPTKGKANQQIGHS
jgi:S-adenosylmethionine/arginine decarboxylase-like enzyme